MKYVTSLMGLYVVFCAFLWATAPGNPPCTSVEAFLMKPFSYR